MLRGQSDTPSAPWSRERMDLQGWTIAALEFERFAALTADARRRMTALAPGARRHLQVVGGHEPVTVLSRQEPVDVYADSAGLFIIQRPE